MIRWFRKRIADKRKRLIQQNIIAAQFFVGFCWGDEAMASKLNGMVDECQSALALLKKGRLALCGYLPPPPEMSASAPKRK